MEIFDKTIKKPQISEKKERFVNVLKFYILEVMEFQIDFQSVRHKYNQTDLDITSNYVWISVSWSEI